MKENESENKKNVVMVRLQSVGISVLSQKKSPKNGRYSGIVGSEREKRIINV